MKHITRDRYLTKEEADRYDKIREQVMNEYPPACSWPHKTMIRIPLNLAKECFISLRNKNHNAGSWVEKRIPDCFEKVGEILFANDKPVGWIQIAITVVQNEALELAADLADSEHKNMQSALR